MSDTVKNGYGVNERTGRTRQWRADRIRRFTEYQRRTREWINFAEIAEWCSKENQSIQPDEEKRETAFATLAADLLSGEFEENGRSRVLFLHPDIVKTRMTRMTREWLQDVIDYDQDGNKGQSQYLPHCWIPRWLFDRWLAKHNLPESPRCFEPFGERVSVPLKKPKRGRPAEYNWDGVKAQLRAYVSQHGDIRLLEELLQKCADFASELHPKKSTPNDKTIREAIKTHGLEAAARADPGK